LSTYQEQRSNIQDGDIVFIHKKHTIVSYLIATITRSQFTHVGIAFWMRVQGTTQRRLMIAEAQRLTKRRIINMSYYSERKMTIVASPKDWIGYSDEALAHLGQINYSWLDVFYIGFREFFSKWIDIKHRNFSGEICSEYVAKLMGLDEISVSPQLLYTKLIDLGNKLKLKINQ